MAQAYLLIMLAGTNINSSMLNPC